MATGMQRTDPVWNSVYQPHLNPRSIVLDEQELIQMMLEEAIMEIAMNRFEWKGLPDEVSERWLEMNVNFYGVAVFHFDPKFDKYFVMQGSPVGTLNLQGDPIKMKVYGNAAYQKEIPITRCVPIWGNYMRLPIWNKVRIYAHRLAVADRTIDINLINLRRTKFIAATENQRGTVSAMNDAIERGDAVIPVNRQFDPNAAITSLDLEMDPDSIINTHIIRTREWSELMTLLGINNSNQDKKERLTAAETAGNDDVIATIRQTALKSRQIAAEQINKMWPNLHVSVDYVTDMVTPVDKDNSPEDTVKNSPANQNAGAK